MKLHHHVAAASVEPPSTRQRLFSRYVIAILVDLVVLNLVAQYWGRVEIDAFSTSLIAAVLLQMLLQATLLLEHRVAALFEARDGRLWTFLRFFCAWLILFGSKFVMLAVIDRILGDGLMFGGPMHGVAAFILVIIAMLASESLLGRLYRRLR